MTTATEAELFQQIDGIKDEFNAMNVTLAKFMGAEGERRKRCDSTFDAVFGNGRIGLTSKMWVVWGLLGAIGIVVIALGVSWAKDFMTHI